MASMTITKNRPTAIKSVAEMKTRSAGGSNILSTYAMTD